MRELTINQLLNIEETLAHDLFCTVTYPWEVLPKIQEFLILLGNRLPKDEFKETQKNVWIHKTAVIAPTALIQGPVIIDAHAEVRHCAFIRGNVLVGANAVVGNSTELKNSILFNFAQVPHYNYVGDSILGFRSHMGAGAITSNLKSDKSLIVIHSEEKKMETGLKKMGAILGDRVEVGCNSVLNPGTVVGRNSNIYPTSMVRGFVKSNSIYKNKSEIVDKYSIEIDRLT